MDYGDEHIKAFIREELEKHGEWLADVFIEQLERNGNRVTGELERSLGFRVTEDGDGDASLEVGFEGYGRFFEIGGWKRRSASRNSWPMNANSVVWGIKERRRKRKPTRWYAKNMYGGLGRLVARLSAGMTEDELQRIKEKLTINN